MKFNKGGGVQVFFENVFIIRNAAGSLSFARTCRMITRNRQNHAKTAAFYCCILLTIRAYRVMLNTPMQQLRRARENRRYLATGNARKTNNNNNNKIRRRINATYKIRRKAKKIIFGDDSTDVLTQPPRSVHVARYVTNRFASSARRYFTCTIIFYVLL